MFLVFWILKIGQMISFCCSLDIKSLDNKIGSVGQINNSLQFKLKMGNSSNLTEWDVKFVQNLDDQNFGNIDIYKNDQGKFIMMLRRTFMKDDKNQYSDNYGFHQLLAYACQQNPTQEFVTPILHSHTKIQNICIAYQIIDTYCEYFNFTLADMIKHKKQMDKQELWMCFHWLIKFILMLKDKGWIIQEGIILKKIFITLKGIPTVSMHHLIKNTTNDQVTEYQSSFIEEAAMCMLQLACMTNINFGDNLELFLRKCEKIDVYLGQILGSILRKSISKRNHVTEVEVLQKIQKLLKEGKIVESNQIKLNKFKYVIPKPELKIHTQNTQKKSLGESQKNPIVINSLHGRKNKENSSLRESNKRSTFDLNDPLPTLQTPMNKTFSIKGALLMDQIENKKKQTEKQKQKLSQRKQLIMKSGPKTSINKQNFLGNSIREVRPSYNRKQSWTRKIISDHLKQSNQR